MGSNPRTLNWRVIPVIFGLAQHFAGQATLKEGVVRRIGDGTETNIWGWPWLADTGDPMLHTLKEGVVRRE
nr:uncharacterized protein LOC109159432 [Ipomoea batatas]